MDIAILIVMDISLKLVYLKLIYLIAVIPLADYYIIAGVVYQAPDLASVINSRLVCTIKCIYSLT